jgi:hypothetical protein
MEWYKDDEALDVWEDFFLRRADKPKIPANTEILFTDFMEYPDGDFTYLGQFSPYKRINYDIVLPIIDSYFSSSERVRNTIDIFLHKYDIDPGKTIGVCYRGNDKLMEANPPSYEEYSIKIDLAIRENPGHKILIQTDESEFVEYAKERYPGCIVISELPTINKTYESQVGWEIERGERTNFAVNFMSAIIILSRCSTVILNSGNVGMWICLYRGNSDNVNQYLSPRKYFYLNDYKYYFETENKWF